ncbi:hypothetical protein ES332_D08G145800v1 [Gossypium tomentosum]|uniref:Uncharacterized protein n=1 Tax=Gossypium tomentosum TaxID=34277 RepID=A0A5D2JVC6_GOSTO|nr:hypothetical protein ES332_D08G145800v1 [Gossypium tomentosum]
MLRSLIIHTLLMGGWLWCWDPFDSMRNVYHASRLMQSPQSIILANRDR